MQRVEVQVLVVDRIVVQFLENHVGAVKLDGAGTIGLETVRHAGHNIVGVRDVRNDIPRKHCIGLTAPLDNAFGDFEAEEFGECADSIPFGHRGNILRRIHAEYAIATLNESLEKGAVIARDLDHEQRTGLAPRYKSLAKNPAIIARTVGRAGDPDVVHKEILRRDCLGQLNRAAFFAAADDKRIRGKRIRPFAAQVVCERLSSQIEYRCDFLALANAARDNR